MEGSQKRGHKTLSLSKLKDTLAYVRPSPCASTRWRHLYRISALGRLIALVQASSRLPVTLPQPRSVGAKSQSGIKPRCPALAPSPPQVSSNRHLKLVGKVGREVQRRKQANPQLNFPQRLTLSRELKKFNALKKKKFEGEGGLKNLQPPPPCNPLQLSLGKIERWSSPDLHPTIPQPRPSTSASACLLIHRLKSGLGFRFSFHLSF